MSVQSTIRARVLTGAQVLAGARGVAGAVAAACVAVVGILVGLSPAVSAQTANSPAFLGFQSVVTGDFRPGGTLGCVSASVTNPSTVIVTSGSATCASAGSGLGPSEPVVVGSGTGAQVPVVTDVSVTATFGTENMGGKGVTQTLTCAATASGSPAPTLYYRWVYSSLTSFGAAEVVNGVSGVGPTLVVDPIGTANGTAGLWENSFFCQAFAVNSAGRAGGYRAAPTGPGPNTQPLVLGSGVVGSMLTCQPSLYFSLAPRDGATSLRWVKLLPGQTFTPPPSIVPGAPLSPAVVYQGAPAPYVVKAADVGYSIRCEEFGSVAYPDGVVETNRRVSGNSLVARAATVPVCLNGVSVEAETGSVSGGSVVQLNSAASGGRDVGSFAFPGSQSWSSPALSTGPGESIRVVFRYYATSGATRTLTVNGTASQVVFPPSSVYTDAAVVVPAVSGPLSFNLSVPAANSGGLAVDAVTGCAVAGTPTTTTTTTTTITAPTTVTTVVTLPGGCSASVPPSGFSAMVPTVWANTNWSSTVTYPCGQYGFGARHVVSSTGWGASGLSSAMQAAGQKTATVSVQSSVQLRFVVQLNGATIASASLPANPTGFRTHVLPFNQTASGRLTVFVQSAVGGSSSFQAQNFAVGSGATGTTTTSVPTGTVTFVVGGAGDARSQATITCSDGFTVVTERAALVNYSLGRPLGTTCTGQVTRLFYRDVFEAVIDQAPAVTLTATAAGSTGQISATAKSTQLQFRFRTPGGTPFAAPVELGVSCDGFGTFQERFVVPEGTALFSRPQLAFINATCRVFPITPATVSPGSVIALEAGTYDFVVSSPSTATTTTVVSTSSTTTSTTTTSTTTTSTTVPATTSTSTTVPSGAGCSTATVPAGRTVIGPTVWQHTFWSSTVSFPCGTTGYNTRHVVASSGWGASGYTTANLAAGQRSVQVSVRSTTGVPVRLVVQLNGATIAQTTIQTNVSPGAWTIGEVTFTQAAAGRITYFVQAASANPAVFEAQHFAS